MNTILNNAVIMDEAGNRKQVNILITGDKITKISKDPLEADGEQIDMWGYTLMPGFIHTHVHLVDNYDPFNEKKLKRWLKSGITHLRDQGILSRHETADIICWRDKLGKSSLYPSLSVCGRFITAQGGYGGIAPLQAETAEDAKEAVKMQAAAGVNHIKIGQDQGYDPSTSGMRLMTKENAAAVCEEAHRLGLTVSAHVREAAQLGMLLEAGIDEAAHTCCDHIPDEMLEFMVKNDVAMTPTLSIYGEITANWGAPFLYTAMENTKRFADMGGIIGLGNDYIEEKAPWSPVGMPVMEIELLQKAGLSMVQIINAATAGGAEIMRSNDRGKIKEGYRADLIAIKGDPLEIPYLLSNVQFVMKDGLIVKQ